MLSCRSRSVVGSTKSQCSLSVSHRQPPQHITGPACVVSNICGPGLIVEKVERYGGATESMMARVIGLVGIPSRLEFR